MKWSIGAKIGVGFGLALLILVIIGAVMYWTTTGFIVTANWVEHTHEVLNELNDVPSQMKDAETGQRGYIIVGEERYLEPYRSAVGAIDMNIKDVRRLTMDNPHQQKRLDALEPLIASKIAELQETIDLRKNRGFEAALQVVRTDKGKKLMDDIRSVVKEMEDEENALSKQRHEEAEASANTVQSTIVGATLFSVVLLSIVGVFITRNIATPLRHLSGIAERIASGDLTVNVPSDNRSDEVGTLAQAFRRMVENLRQVTGEIQEGVNVLGSSASEILAATTQVASGAAETATVVSETTTTVEEVKQTAQVSSQKARYVSESAQKSAQISQTGKQSVEETIEGMSRIRGQVESIADSIVRLSEQSQAIGEIIATVNDLAEQSNLLAVNAAIEAAKAGEQGRGFAVVAQEVKNLAEQSKQATAQVRTILGDIQKATNAAVMVTEQGSKAVETGVKQSTEAGEAIRMLAESIVEAAQAVTQIAASSQQQLVGMDQVALAMENIKLASTQNVASTRQAETAAQNLHDLGQRLKQLVERYKV